MSGLRQLVTADTPWCNRTGSEIGCGLRQLVTADIPGVSATNFVLFDGVAELYESARR